MNAEQIEKFTETKIVAVVRKIDSHKINYVVESLIKGGMKSIEITMDSENCLNHISDLKKRYPTDIFIGAGTVLDTDDAKAVLEVGADFVVSPIVNREMIEYVKERNKIVVPGAFSPTEIYNAYEYGATMVKLFPANVLGPGFIKDIKGPLGHIPIMTTGGIDLNNIKDFFKQRAEIVGVGGSLLREDLISANNWSELEKLSATFITEIGAQ